MRAFARVCARVRAPDRYIININESFQLTAVGAVWFAGVCEVVDDCGPLEVVAKNNNNDNK